MKSLLGERYECKMVGCLGPDESDDKEIVVLNRIIRYLDDDGPEIQIECDARHAEIVVKDLGLAAAKPVATPSVNIVMKVPAGRRGAPR